jgi:hypothetical protein
MPKSRTRKGKKKLLQVVDVPEFLIRSHRGKPMKVKNPKWKPGKQKHIVHNSK